MTLYVLTTNIINQQANKEKNGETGLHMKTGGAHFIAPLLRYIMKRFTKITEGWYLNIIFLKEY